MRTTLWVSILFTNTTDRLHSILHFRPLPASTSGSGQPQWDEVMTAMMPMINISQRKDIEP